MPAKPVQDQVFRIGDKISVHFVDPANGEDRLFEEIVKADGTITLLSNQVFIVEGKTFGDLEGALRGIYGDKYFRPSQPSTRFYYVAGEVKIPTRQVYVGQLTVLQAIASSGGFTERADKRKVQLTHSGQTRIINCAKAQEDGMLNMEVGPGDRIFVPRSKWLW